LIVWFRNEFGWEWNISLVVDDAVEAHMDSAWLPLIPTRNSSRARAAQWPVRRHPRRSGSIGAGNEITGAVTAWRDRLR
jgi:hypothetical protein